jgi:flagellar hook assembly protein FlgD
VTIRILDFGMNLVKTLIQNANRNGNIDHFENWDGRDEFGNIVSNGVYFYRIDRDSADPVYGKIMVMR